MNEAKMKGSAVKCKLQDEFAEIQNEYDNISRTNATLLQKIKEKDEVIVSLRKEVAVVFTVNHNEESMSRKLQSTLKEEEELVAAKKQNDS